VLKEAQMIDERHNPEAIVKFAEALLSRRYDQEARLVLDRVFSGFKSVVVRCRVESSGAGLPEALIVKKAREDRVGYYPESQATPNAAHELFNDWAAARFLKLQALGKSARDAAQRLKELWPAEVCSLPYYPVFKD
jgi:hypothetical protein